MDKNTKVTLTEAWWKTNKPKTLKEKGNFTKALKDFDALWKVSGTVKGPKAMQVLEKALETLDAVTKAAAATASGCVKGIHDGAKHVLTKTLPAEAARCKKVLEKRIDDINADYDKITVADCLKDRTLYGHLNASINRILARRRGVWGRLLAGCRPATAGGSSSGVPSCLGRIRRGLVAGRGRPAGGCCR